MTPCPSPSPNPNPNWEATWYEDYDGDVQTMRALENAGEGHNTCSTQFISGCASYSIVRSSSVTDKPDTEQLLLQTEASFTRDSWDTRGSNWG